MTRKLRALATISTLAAAVGVPAIVPFSASAHVARVTTTSTTTPMWPMFHRNAMHRGVSGDQAISTANAASLKVAWHADLVNGSMSSPAVAIDAKTGRALVYVGDQVSPNSDGMLSAFDATTGRLVWRYRAGSNVTSSPAVFRGVVYVGTFGHKLLAVNASTGALRCSFTAPGRISSSPVVANISNVGPTVMFGDNGQTGGPDPGSFWALNASTCAVRWRFRAFGDPPGSTTPQTGSYDEPGYVLSASGVPLVLFGSTDPDDAVYALDARSGRPVWRFQTKMGMDTDVGAGPTVSAPGVNGFADGVVYITGKDRMVYALDLSTGQPIWQFDIKADNPANTGESQSVASLYRRQLVLGWGGGVYDLNAVTGAVIWKVSGLPEILSSPAIVGPSGQQVVVVGDTTDSLHIFALKGGHRVSTRSFGGAIYSSPAVAAGKIFFTTVDSHTLYALSV